MTLKAAHKVARNALCPFLQRSKVDLIPNKDSSKDSSELVLKNTVHTRV